MSSIIELEIIRARCYYNFYDTVLLLLEKNFDIYNIINNSEVYGWNVVGGFIFRIRNMIVEWIYYIATIRSLYGTNSKEYLFNGDINPEAIRDLRYQIYNNLMVLLSKHVNNKDDIYPFSKNLCNIVIYSFKEYNKIIKGSNPIKSNKVSITKDQNDKYILSYTSKSVNALPYDSHVKIKDDTISMIYHSDPIYLNSKMYDINVVFADYFRYKYIYSNNQTLAYKYDTKKNEGIECFSAPFNRHHEYYCSAFPDLELKLGSEGDFFDLIIKAINGKYKFPVKKLKINPVFVEFVVLRMSELVIKLLDQKVKYEIEIILPNWKNFRGKDLLLDCKYLINYNTYQKGDLIFDNGFTGDSVSPTSIIIIYLNN